MLTLHAYDTTSEQKLSDTDYYCSTDQRLKLSVVNLSPFRRCPILIFVITCTMGSAFQSQELVSTPLLKPTSFLHLLENDVFVISTSRLFYRRLTFLEEK